MKTRLSLLDLLTFAVFAVQAAFALHVGLNGPTDPTLPLHWNSRWEVDRWGTGAEFGVFYGGMSVIGLIAAGGMGLGARRADKEGDPSRARALRIGQGILVFVLGVTGLMAAAMTVGGLSDDGAARLAMAGLSLIFAGLGAVLGRVAPNPLVGVRTPWNYKSRRAWDRSNRLAGRLFFLTGIAGLIATPVAPQPQGALALIIAALVIAGASVAESWRVWRSDPDRRPF